MTSDEHDRLKLAADATAARNLMLWAGRLLHDALPREEPARSQCMSIFETKLLLARMDYLQMTFPEMAPAMSDLWAGEAQEAFDRLSKEFLASLDP